ncbi:MAG: RAMP superfamily CRISPR-associated protein [Acidobacteriota bacterium]|nr:RAMP superfamily CRISPR-associated protein [Acidobacteriota bacterium]
MKKVSVSYRLTAASGVIVGSSADVLSIGIDKATIRRRKVKIEGLQEPLIPGSTLKGKIRYECERLLDGLGQAVCHAPHPDTMCPHDPQLKVEQMPCEVCKLFGGPSQQSRLFFGDATINNSNVPAQFLTRVQAGVSISRKRRTAEDERLFYAERGVDGITYEGKLEGYLEDDQLALVITAIERLTAIGGGKSRGAGWTNVEIVSVALDGRNLSRDEWQKLRVEGLPLWRASK